MFNRLKPVLPFICVFAGLFVGLFLGTNLAKKAESKPKREELEILVNEWRKSNGLDEYTWSSDLCIVAGGRMTQIWRSWDHGKFLNDSPLWFKIAPYKDMGENLARDFKTSQEVLNGWIESPTHLENLKKDFTNSCIETDGNFVVQMFGKY